MKKIQLSVSLYCLLFYLFEQPALAIDIEIIPLFSNDIIYDSFKKKIYASVPSSAGLGLGNTITTLDPFTRTIEKSVFIGSEPNKLAISDNGQYLYVGLDGAAAVRRYNIATQTAELQFRLGSGQYTGPFFAEDIEVLPGQPNSIAVSRRNEGFIPRHEGVAIYDNGVLRANTTPGHTGSNEIEFSENASTLYGYDNEHSDFMRTMSVDSNGVQIVNVAYVNGFGIDIEFDSGRLYSTSGRVINPRTSELLGSFAVEPFGNLVEPDSSNGKVYFLTDGVSSSTGIIKVFDSNNFALIDEFTFGALEGWPINLIGLENGKLAFNTEGSLVGTGQLFLIDTTSTDFSGSTVISSDVQNGLNAIGGKQGDTLLIDAGFKVSRVDLNNFPFTVTNNGTVKGIMFDETGNVINNGTITERLYGIQINNRTNNCTLSKCSVKNNGNILADHIAIKLNGEGSVTNSGNVKSGVGIYLKGGRVSNSGNINAANGIEIVGDGTVENSGTINSSYLTGISISGEGSVTNGGTISGEFEGISIHHGNITNSGLIAGDLGIILRFLNKNSLIINSGTITGVYYPAISMAGGTVINSGTILNTGDDYPAVYMADGTIINSGTISSNSGRAIYMPWFINGTVIVILQTGSEVNGDIEGGSFAGDTAILQGSASFSDAFRNFEHLRMDGIDWRLSGNSTFGETQIDSGLLRIDGTLTSPVSIGPEGALGGNGTISGDVINYGSVAPGNSIGTTTIDGDFSHLDGANLVIEFDSTKSDLLNVTGRTSLGGGFLTLIPLNLTPTPNTFTFLRSGSLSGQFANVITPILPAVFNLELNVVGNDMQVVTRRNTYQSFAATNNQSVVGAVLQADLADASSNLQAIHQELDRFLTGKQIQSALEQLTPEPFTAFPQVVFTDTQMFTNTLANHLNNLHIRSLSEKKFGQALTALAFNDSPGLLSLALSDRKGSGLSTSDEWQVYLQPYGVFSSLDSNRGFTGFNANTGGVAIGFDRYITNRTVIGANLSWSSTNIVWDRSGTNGNVETGRLAAYWGYSENNWNLNGIISYGFNRYESDRRVIFGTFNRLAENDHNGQAFSAFLSGAYRFRHGNLIYGPTASLQYVGLFEDDYLEHGAGAANLKIEGKDRSSLRSTLGLRAAMMLDLDGDQIVIPEVHGGWAHEVLDNEYTLNAQFQGLQNGSFNIHGRNLGNDSAYLGAGITAKLNKNALFTLRYDADVGRNDYLNHVANLNLVLRF
ncbi:MAG: autotransporter domain-containing protein [Gammaproteobacteria bacterium]